MTSDTVVFGIDIESGYSRVSRREPKYAVAILKNGVFIDEYRFIPLTRLIRLIWEYRPCKVATDNVLELVRGMDELVKLSTILPSDTVIVQVTGWGRELEDIRLVASKHGIQIPRGKLSPIETAKLCALLADKGIGWIVKPVADRTKILVTRGRCVAHGGMSLNRFQRSVRVSVLRVTREVKDILEKNGLEYDLIMKRSVGGLEKSVFIVYASADTVSRLVKPLNTKSVKIIVKPYVKKIPFEQLKSEATGVKGLILGLDPGITVGVALVDLDGKPVLAYSSKNLDRFDIIETVSKLGKVVIVSTDKKKPSEFVKKISSALGAELYVPEEDISVDEKEHIASLVQKQYSWIRVKDNHVRDALAAAYKAYYSIADKLRSIDAKLKDIELDIDKERIRIEVVRGKDFAQALEEALMDYIKSIISSRRVETDINMEISEENYIERIKELKARIAYLETQVRKLENEIKIRDSIIEDLKQEYRRVRFEEQMHISDRRIYALEQEISSLRREIEKKDILLNELYNKVKLFEDFIKKIINGKALAVPRIKNLCLSSINSLINEYPNINLVYVDEIYPIDSNAFNLLRKMRIAVLTLRCYGDLYKEMKVPILEARPLAVFDDFVIVARGFEKDIDNMWKIIEEIESREEFEKILKLIKSYQEERRKTLS
ncbi:MAG: DUF460 domain-containing protein [Desulfurococcaceae archaeon]